MTGAVGFKEGGSLSGSVSISIVGIDDDSALYAAERLCIENTPLLIIILLHVHISWLNLMFE